MDKCIFNKLFKNPSAKYRAKPFWAWNGELDEKELKYQLGIFKEMGMGGAFFHSRTGLATKYLGDEWFDLINACADECERLGLEGWLYDEDRWPSGSAGGMVAENEEYRTHYLQMKISSGEDFVYTNDVVAAFEITLDGLSFTNKRRLAEGETCNGTVVWFYIEPMRESSNYNGTSYIDCMNREAVECFINLTHERYAETAGERLGTSIKGIFTDEPHRGAVMCSFGVTNEANSAVPYTPKLFEEFKVRFGYDLKDNLPELFLQKDGVKVSPVKWHYMELTQQLFNENFMIPIQDWCHKHNIKLTGHVLHEDSLTTQACMLGSVMRAYEYMDIPGIDVLGEYRRVYWAPVQLRSVARQLGIKEMMSELYGCTGWQMNLRSYKEVGDWQSLFGVTLRCPHLSWYTMEGEAKRDFPASISCQSPWYKEYKQIEDYFSRMQIILSLGNSICDTLVVNPIESVWSVIHPGWSNNELETLDEDVKKLEEHYESLFYALAGNQIDFDYGDEHYIKKLGKIVKLEDGTTALQIGEMTYKTVIVPYMLTIRSSTVKLLKEFADKGGKVIFTFEPPMFVDAVPSDVAKSIIGTVCDISNISSFVTSSVVHLDSKFNQIYMQVRELEDGYAAVLINTDTEIGSNNVTLSFDEEFDIEQFDIRTGNIKSIGHGKMITVDFEPSMEYCIKLSRRNDLAAVRNISAEENKAIELCGPFRYTLSEPNICVLDMAEYSINGEWYERTDVLIADKNIRRKLGLELRGGEMLQPWFIADKEHKVVGQISLRFDFSIETMPEKLKLAIEHPENFVINLNGCTSAFTKVNERWIDSCYTVLEVDISKCAIGTNVIELSTGMRDNLNLEAMFLLGDFGVRLDGSHSIITKLPDFLEIGDLCEQGLPFYSAGVTYHIDNLPNDINSLALSKFEGAVVKIEGNGKEKIIFSPPYVADISSLNEDGKLSLTCILTRKNTFGPLHYAPIWMEAIWPDMFVIEDEEIFCKDRYALIKQGLTKPILLYKDKEM